MLDHGHNHYFFFVSLAIALMSGFTGLSLTQGASMMSVVRKKLVVSMSALALGSGIWSMHFVAMLGMTLPVPFHYNALITVASALVAILITGAALLLVHFGERTAHRIRLAGLCVGCGIIAMHYIGMAGIQDVKPVYSTVGVATAIFASLVLCVASFSISYGQRGSRNILFGTIVFGTTVVAVHFIAMAGTHFVEINGGVATGLWLSNEVLAFGVTITSFLISGAFLLMGVTFATSQEDFQAESDPVNKNYNQVEPTVREDALVVRVPYERNGQTHFVQSDEIAAVQAEGRYTVLYHQSGKLFCPWSLSVIESRLTTTCFLKVHRSYMINIDHVTGFERKKDNGFCSFEEQPHLHDVPVSRSYLKRVRLSLGL